MQNHSNHPSIYTYRNETRQRSIQNFGIFFTKNVLKFRCFFNLSGPPKVPNKPSGFSDRFFVSLLLLSSGFIPHPSPHPKKWAKHEQKSPSNFLYSYGESFQGLLERHKIAKILPFFGPSKNSTPASRTNKFNFG